MNQVANITLIKGEGRRGRFLTLAVAVFFSFTSFCSAYPVPVSKTGAGLFFDQPINPYMTLTEKLQEMAALKERLAILTKEVKAEQKTLRHKLPKGWQEQLKAEFPELDTFDNGARVSDVFNGRSMDGTLITALESLCAKPVIQKS